LQGDDLILCQITSQARDDRFSVRLDTADFVSGGLSQSSRIRPSRLFTADSGIVVYRAGHGSAAKLKEVRETLIRILSE
jgi:mRNA interferase MazF